MRRLNPDALERGSAPRLGERSAAASRRGRKTPPRRRPVPRWRRIAWRLAGAAVVVLPLLGGIGWLWHSGLPAKIYGRLSGQLLSASADAGYRLRQVVVEGRQNTPRDQLLAALGVQRGEALMAIDPQALQTRLKQIGWIRAASVERRLPDEIDIRITEAVPAAIWQKSGSFRLIDREGRSISDADIARFARLPVIVGVDAPGHIGELLDMLDREPDLAIRVKAAVWVGERRWNLRFDNGVDVKLPAESPQAAWSLLARLQREQSLLARDVEVIDMRMPDRLVVRLGPTAELQRQPGNDT
jgi:cell division protein FtsQ